MRSHPLKIFYICAVDLTNFDAQRTHIIEVVTEMAKKNQDVTLFFPEFSKISDSFGFPFHSVPILLKKSKLKFIEYEIRIALILWKYFMLEKPHLIYVRKGFLTLLPAVLGRCFKIPVVLEANGVVSDEVRLAFNLPLFAVKIFAMIENLNSRFADRIIAVTQGIKDYLIQRYKARPEKIEVISNGVNISKFKPPVLPQKGKTVYLGFAGHLVPWAGLDYLLRGLKIIRKSFPEVHVLIVGDGPGRKILEDLMVELNLSDAVHLYGMVKPEQVPDLLNRFFIGYIPAIRSRNARIGISPIKLFEYLACGIPVIASDIHGMEIISENKVGFVIEPESTEALIEATWRLLHDRNLHREMSDRAVKLVREKYTWEKTTERILENCRILVSS